MALLFLDRFLLSCKVDLRCESRRWAVRKIAWKHAGEETHGRSHEAACTPLVGIKLPTRVSFALNYTGGTRSRITRYFIVK